MPDSSSSERSVCQTGHKTTEKRTPLAQARVTSKRLRVQNTLTHFSHHEQQPETPSTVAVVLSDSSDTHFVCDASIDVYKYGHSKRIYRYRYQWLWTKFRQRHVNLPKLRRRNVCQTGDIKNPPNRTSLSSILTVWRLFSETKTKLPMESFVRYY